MTDNVIPKEFVEPLLRHLKERWVIYLPRLEFSIAADGSLQYEKIDVDPLTGEPRADRPIVVLEKRR